MEDSTTLWKHVPVLSNPHGKRVSPYVQMEPPEFQFEPIDSCLVTGQRRKEPRSIFFTSSRQGLESIDEIYPEPCPLRAKWSQLSQPLFT